MFGLELVMASWLTMASWQDDIKCEPQRKPRVTVLPSKSPLKFNFQKSRDELQQLEIDTISPYGPGVETHLNGAMSGAIQLETKVSYLSNTYSHPNYPGEEQSCIFVDQIQVNIHFDPTIYIVREYPKGTCEHEAVMEHEKKHLKVNQIVINKYTERISKTLSYAMNKYGTSYGPFFVAETPGVYERLKEYYVGIVKDEEKRMYAELLKLNQDIDTIEEYERVRNACL
ncbi:MAG: hypothetical protein AAF569_00050 [Pseudomonadota bacterium]